MAAVPRAHPRSVLVQLTHCVSSSVLTRWSLTKVVMTRGDACRLQGSLRMLLGREIFGDLWQALPAGGKGASLLECEDGKGVSVYLQGVRLSEKEPRIPALSGC